MAGTVSLQTDAVLTAPEAVAAIASASGGRILGDGSADVRVVLSDSAEARVGVSKFGDEVPVTIDVTDARGPAAAFESAATLRTRLVAATSWTVAEPR